MAKSGKIYLCAMQAPAHIRAIVPEWLAKETCPSLLGEGTRGTAARYMSPKDSPEACYVD